MKQGTPLGSGIAEVHNGSSLFTGDAGQGESNIRRWIIENDWLEAIIALPLNMFYNAGIATYIWVLSNRKSPRRQGRVQLIDATERFQPLRKNLGKKNCELTEEHIRRVCDTFLAFEETDRSKVFPNEAFGYWKVTVERPLRLRVDLTDAALGRFRTACEQAKEEPLANVVDRVAQSLGPGPHRDFSAFLAAVDAEAAEPVIRKTHKPGKIEADPLCGRYATKIDGKRCVVEYEPDPELRDTEQVPLLEDGGVEAFIQREVLPHTPDAWIDESATRIGYEVSFTRYFYKPQRLRTLAEIKADVHARQAETEGLLEKILVETEATP